MSDHGTHHHHHGDDHNAEPKSKTSFQASFWVVLILVGLFIGAINFISAMGHEEGGHQAAGQQHGAPGTHQPGGHEGAPGHAPTSEDHGGDAAEVHTTGSADKSTSEHGGAAHTDSAAHH